MLLEFTIIVLLFFLVALVYSTAGFGGGSSYLAILALSSINYIGIRPIALICNITVVGFSTWLFMRHKIIPFKKILPLVLFSIPLAYIGGRFMITERAYFLVLAICLFCSGALLLIRSLESVVRHHKTKIQSSSINALIGGGIGYISGLVGIGGGIFLAPLLHLIKWEKPKAIAGTAAFFILVNSVAGFIGQLSLMNSWSIDWRIVLPLVLAVLLGGQIGIRLTVFRLDPSKVRLITAFLILFVALRLLYKYL